MRQTHTNLEYWPFECIEGMQQAASCSFIGAAKVSGPRRGMASTILVQPGRTSHASKARIARIQNPHTRRHLKL
eukprot:2645963-Amphidinium_carterae.1